MITIYTTCRDSKKWPRYGTLQYNAIKSWTFLEPRPQILVIGNDPGSKELCEELNVTHIPNVELNEEKVPFIADMIEIAEKKSKNNTMLLCASDVILLQDVTSTCISLNEKMEKFCGVAIRHVRNVKEKIDFSEDWQKDIKTRLGLGGPRAGDYFLHNKGFWENMPPLVIGRCVCDNWMFWYAMQKKCLVNMTEALTIIHQNHKKFETEGRGVNLRKSPGFKNNSKYYKRCSINKANWKMNKDLELEFIH